MYFVFVVKEQHRVHTDAMPYNEASTSETCYKPNAICENITVQIAIQRKRTNKKGRRSKSCTFRNKGRRRRLASGNKKIKQLKKKLLK